MTDTDSASGDSLTTCGGKDLDLEVQKLEVESPWASPFASLILFLHLEKVVTELCVTKLWEEQMGSCSYSTL